MGWVVGRRLEKVEKQYHHNAVTTTTPTPTKRRVQSGLTALVESMRLHSKC